MAIRVVDFLVAIATSFSLHHFMTRTFPFKFMDLFFFFPQEGQIVAFNPANDATFWECVEDTGNCPGRLEYACGDDPLQLIDDECECPLQWLVRQKRNYFFLKTFFIFNIRYPPTASPTSFVVIFMVNCDQ